MRKFIIFEHKVYAQQKDSTFQNHEPSTFCFISDKRLFWLKRGNRQFTISMCDFVLCSCEIWINSCLGLHRDCKFKCWFFLKLQSLKTLIEMGERDGERNLRAKERVKEVWGITAFPGRLFKIKFCFSQYLLD